MSASLSDRREDSSFSGLGLEFDIVLLLAVEFFLFWKPVPDRNLEFSRFLPVVTLAYVLRDSFEPR